MRVLITGILASAAVLSVAACNKPAAGGSAAAPAATAAPAAPASGPISLQNLPHRRPGLWRQTMVMEGMPQGMPETQLCIDAPSEAKMSLMGQQVSREHCETPQFSRNLDGSITFSSTCDFGGAAGKTVSHGTISGDFNSSYTTVIDSTHSGGAGSEANSTHKMTITSTRIGECQPGQKGGDMIMPGGRTMNLINDR
jgi:hypothetical protein